MNGCKLVCVGLLVFSVGCIKAAEGVPAEDRVLSNDPARVEAFMDWGLGMFVHWSLDSQLGSVISHSMVGASEDYIDRYIKGLPQTFNPSSYNPDEWMVLAKLAGVKYMVFTTKHHNGFCMWDTQTTDFNIMNTPYGKDIVRDYIDACRRHGIKVGLYFSPEDFFFQHQTGVTIRRRGGTDEEKPALAEYNRKQLDELFGKYGEIDMIFFDGRGGKELAQYIHELQPQCIVTRGEMHTPEQKLPKDPMPGPWESCFTLGSQWQFKPTNEEYKTGGTLIDMLAETRAKGGNLLINMGPEPSGIIPHEQARIFRELALWMFVNQEAIHDIRPGVVIGEEGILYTQSKEGNTVYAFMRDLVGDTPWRRKDRKEITFAALRATDQTQVSILGQNDLVYEYEPDVDATTRFKQTDEGLQVSALRAQRLYNNRKWPNMVVLKLENVEFVDAASD